MNAKTCTHCGYSQANTNVNCIYCGRKFVVPGLSDYVPTTQKAKGLYALQAGGTGVSVHNPWLTFPVGKDIPEKLTAELLASYAPVFARPCPPSPEHGFVESRKVSSLKELESLRLETLAANADSEIMLMKQLDAKFNAVWTPSLLSIGPGHDGATAGKQVVSFPLAGLNPLSKDLLAKAGIKPDKAPYIEAVYAEGGVSWGETIGAKPHLVQLRAGPPLESVNIDYVPKPIVVLAVRQTAGEDLLEWAKVIRALPDGHVVHHPGGSLTDHYSVHCRENGVPILISRAPEVGEKLTPAPMADPDPAAMQLGVVAGSIAKLGTEYNYQNAVNLILLALHNSPALRGEYSYWLGVAASIMIRLGSAALQGESRHAHNAVSKVRGDVYSYYIPKPISFHRARLSRVTHLLTYGFGNPKASHGFGGYKWGLCGAAMVPVFNAIRQLFREPTPKAASELTLALNLAVNQAHNGGWWLNKFASQQAYNEVPKGNLLWTLNAGPLIYEIGGQKQRADALAKLSSYSAAIKAWPETEIKPLTWRRPTLDIIPGAFVINLRASTVPTGRSITVPVSADLIKQLLVKPGRLTLADRAVNFVMPDGEVIEIWKDIDLKPDDTRV